MKTIRIFGLAIVAALAFSNAQAQNDNEKPYLTKNFSSAGLTAVKAETSGGNVSVYGQKGGEARIEVFIRGNNWKGQLSESEIKERLENYEIKIDKDANTLTATARRINNNWNWKDGLSISFRIYAPADITSDLRTSGGNVRFENLSGTQRAKTSGGNISVASSRGTADIETSGGNINVSDFDGSINAHTSGGNISADDTKGSLKFDTSGGNIRLAQVGGSLNAETSGGNISADIESLEKQLSLSTSGGNIKVTMPLNKGMDLDLSGDKVSIAMQNFNGVIKDDKVQGKLNGGGIPVRIRTSGGRVQVN